MKKQMISVLLTAAMLAGSCMSVYADATVLKTNTLQDVDLIYNSSLLEKRGGNGYALAALDGTALTGEIYANFTTDGVYIIAAENTDTMDCRGVLDNSGKELIPCKYSEIDVLNQNWILAIMLETATADKYDYSSWDDEYYLIKTVDVYNVADGVGTCVASLTRDQYIDSRAFGPYINIQDRTTNAVTTYDGAFNVVAEVDDVYDEELPVGDRFTFDENGQEGLKDAAGNVVMPASFKYIYDFRHGYAEVSTGDLYGLIDYDGNVVVPAEYEEVATSYYLPVDENGDTSGYNANGYFAVIKDGKLGYVTAGGNVTCEPKYSKDLMENNGASALFADMEGNTRILAADGVETVLEGYDGVSAMYYGSGMYYEVTDADYNKGMIDWHGQVIFPCEYSDIELTADGQYVVVKLNDYTTAEIYQISGDAVPAGEVVETAEEAVTEALPATDATDEEISEAEAAVEEVPVAEEEAPTGDNAEAIVLIDSAVTLLNAGSGTDSVIALLTEAINLLGDSNSSATLLLEKSIEQLGQDGDNAEVVASMLTSITKLL